jgi:hypothetical protein
MSELQEEYISKLEGTVRELRQRVAELEANERAYERIVGKKSYQEIADELAASQAREQQLREGLEQIVSTKCTVGDSVNMFARSLLAVQNDKYKEPEK